MCLRTKAAIRTPLLRKLNEYRVAIDTFWCLGGGLVQAEFSDYTYPYAMLLVLAAVSLLAPT